jgi:hypothetical protein
MADDKPRRRRSRALATALKAVLRSRPDPAAWEKAASVARRDHGSQADAYLATLLARNLARRPAARQPAIIAGLAGLLAGTASAALVQALAAGTEEAGRQLALALFARRPAPLDLSLVPALCRLLAERKLPSPAKLAALAVLFRTTGPDSPHLAEPLQALIHGRSKTRALTFLQRLERRTGPSPVLDAVRARLEEALRLSCPRCPAQLRRPEMIQHLWEQHQLVLDGRRVRDPWSLVEEWVAAYRDSRDPELIQRCRTLAGRLDGGQGLRKLDRLLLARQVADEETRAAVLGEARRTHASLCPWCFALVPQPPEMPPLDVFQVDGSLGAAGYNVLVSDAGWQTLLEIRTPQGLLQHGPEPGRRWTRRGLRAAFAAPLLLLALLFALGAIAPGRPPLAPVLVLLAGACISCVVIQLVFRPPFPAAERARRHAWELLVPQLFKSEVRSPESEVRALTSDSGLRTSDLTSDSAFLAGLARHSLKDGLGSLRAALLPPLVKRLEQAVAEGAVPPSHLAAVRRLLVADAVAGGADPIPLVVGQVSLCFEGKLPLFYAENLLDGWESPWWTRGNLNRLRVLLCDRAFEAGYELRNLVDAGQTVPSLGTVLRTDRPNELATLRLLWSLRAGRPWDRCGPARTAFELAADPEQTELFSLYPDLLLWQEEPDWPKVAEVSQDEPAPVQIAVTARGVVCQQCLFAGLPRRVELSAQLKRCELRLDDKIFWSAQVLDELEHRLERWFRYTFLDLLPRLSAVPLWQSPDRTTLFIAWGARACPECHKYFLPRAGAVGIAQVEDAPVAQVVP